uniref:transposase zinc-binding domain-containing protein n=1 Tax=Flavisphingomonas formosensis TaxID=861534 RepID=UPI0018E01DA0
MVTLPTERPVTPLRQRMLDDMAMRSMRARTDIFRAAGPAYRANHAGHVSLHQLKVMSAIDQSRSLTSVFVNVLS